MKYLILIYHNPETRDVFESLSDEARAAGFRAYAALSKDLAEADELIASEPLAYPSEGKGVTVQDGQTIVSDGPFAEAKEHLAGFYLIDVESMERAIACAARVPEALAGMTVEVRPVQDYGGAMDV